MKHRPISVLALVLVLVVGTFLPVSSTWAAPYQQDAPALATASAEVNLSDQFGRTIVSAPRQPLSHRFGAAARSPGRGA